MEKIILIVSQDGTRTGAPVLLLNTLKWIKNNSEYRFVLILRDGGELLEEFRAICDVYIWPNNFSLGTKIKPGYGFKNIVKNTLILTNILWSYLLTIRIKLIYNPKLIYSNTATNGDILYRLKKIIRVGLISNIHEGERMLDLFNAEGFVAYGLGISNTVITVSESVKFTLQGKYKVFQNIHIIPGGVDTVFHSGENHRSLLSAEGIDTDKKIIMCCGWPNWNKGIDLFIQLALHLAKQNEKLHFVWLGGQALDPNYQQMKFDIDKLDLSDRITLITSKPNAIDFIDCADIFLMLSREESFSLVTLEAGLANKPVLCFDKSGGPLEIVNFDSRFIVPYADLNKMSERILEILNDKDQYLQMSKYLNERVINNYSIEKCASSVLKVIKQYV